MKELALTRHRLSMFPDLFPHTTVMFGDISGKGQISFYSFHWMEYLPC
jgi:hypothetical protein